MWKFGSQYAMCASYWKHSFFLFGHICAYKFSWFLGILAFLQSDEVHYNYIAITQQFMLYSISVKIIHCIISQWIMDSSTVSCLSSWYSWPPSYVQDWLCNLIASELFQDALHNKRNQLTFLAKLSYHLEMVKDDDIYLISLQTFNYHNLNPENRPPQNWKSCTINDSSSQFLAIISNNQ